MAEGVVWLAAEKQGIAESGECVATVLVRHNDVTPDYFVMLQLQSVFELSDELVEHIIRVGRASGVAYVVTRPRKEAEELVKKARVAAQMFGFPLVFGLEQEVCRPEPDSQDATHKSAVSSFILCFAWFLILCVSVSYAP